MANVLRTEFGYKVSSQEACAPKDSRYVSCNCAVSWRSIGNDGFFGRECDEVMVGPLVTQDKSDSAFVN